MHKECGRKVGIPYARFSSRWFSLDRKMWGLTLKALTEQWDQEEISAN